MFKWKGTGETIGCCDQSCTERQVVPGPTFDASNEQGNEGDLGSTMDCLKAESVKAH